ncbi:uncharacterized protein L201_004146 [Kwoniella dendrophila CBS 6074]|uniref:Uncharacterized protein n=1 Tax=Kwoniella dendrophila CBS 6074 TaxID=1295534 RepID=A0AAX4JWM1_9TREE
MSLGVSPTTSSPITTHSRPLPPSKRTGSYTPSPRVTPCITPDSSFLEDLDKSLPSSPCKVIQEQHGTMGGLRERSEDELARANRDELESALRSEWEEKGDLLQRIEQVEEERKSLLNKQGELLKNINALQSKNDEAFNERGRMEADLEERDELLERLRKRLTEAERQARESQKRYIEQEQTFDIERQALQAQENHLQQKLKSLSSSSSSSRRSITPTPSIGNEQDIIHLKDELASINISHSTLLAKLNTITKELHELKILNQELQEENEGWEFLIRERTLNGKFSSSSSSDHYINNNDSFTSPTSSNSSNNDNDGKVNGFNINSMKELKSASSLSAPLNRLDEELEEEMSELNSDLENQSPIFDDDHQNHFFVTNLDGSKENDFLAPPSASTRKSRRGRKTHNSFSDRNGSIRNKSSSGLDLAAELDLADDQSMTSTSDNKDEMTALRAEVKQLKESNKALTLYCSKIIDRIITQEGFEHILSVDYKTRRAGTRSASSSSRPALKDVAANSWGLTTSSPISEEPPKIEEPEPIKQKKARPLSMMVRAMTGPPEKIDPPSVSPQLANPPTIEVEDKEAKADKRARRGFSLDFRSLGFGTSSYTAPSPSIEIPKPNLRPLTLSSRSSSSLITVPVGGIAKITNSNAARKLDIHEEDEEDRRERHRMEATLKLMGINKSNEPNQNQNQDQEVLKADDDRGEIENTIPFDEIQNPEQAKEALDEFDKKQSKKIKDIQKGRKSFDNFTSPPKLHSRRSSPNKHNSLDLHREPEPEPEHEFIDTDMMNDEELKERIRTISKSESINTLWSLGGENSRPNSGEFVMNKK